MTENIEKQHETFAIKQAKELEVKFLQHLKEIEREIHDTSITEQDAMWAQLLLENKATFEEYLKVVHEFLEAKDVEKYRTMDEWLKKRIEEINDERTAKPYTDLRLFLQQHATPLYTQEIEASKRKAAEIQEKIFHEKVQLITKMPHKELVEMMVSNPALHSAIDLDKLRRKQKHATTPRRAAKASAQAKAQ